MLFIYQLFSATRADNSGRCWAKRALCCLKPTSTQGTSSPQSSVLLHSVDKQSFQFLEGNISYSGVLLASLFWNASKIANSCVGWHCKYWHFGESTFNPLFFSQVFNSQISPSNRYSLDIVFGVSSATTEIERRFTGHPYREGKYCLDCASQHNHFNQCRRKKDFKRQDDSACKLSQV